MRSRSAPILSNETMDCPECDDEMREYYNDRTDCISWCCSNPACGHEEIE